MPRMTGGEAIVDSLLRHGIDTVFGLPGVQTYGLFDAFARNSNRLRLINARHEQTTAYMALGYACAPAGRPPTPWCRAPACSTPRPRSPPPGASTRRCCASPARCPAR